MKTFVKKSIQIGIQWETVSALDAPMKTTQIKKVFREFFKLIRSEAEWRELVIEFGAEPDSLGILFCDDQRMRGFQKEYRGLERSTDILSFPARELSEAWSSEDEVYLGDLVLSLPAVARGAKRGRRSFKDELTEVLIHGALHLLGCDHVRGAKVNAAKAARMRFLQQSLFRRIRATIK